MTAATRDPYLSSVISTQAESPSRLLASVLFTDICGSTRHAVTIGDRRWCALLDRHDAILQRRVLAFGGRQAKLTGDGGVAYFATPGAAVAAALAIIDDASSLGLIVRAGVHTGEVELRGADIAGIAMHLAARICDAAGPGEVLSSGTVRDLLSGGDYRFGSRGEFALKGIPDPRELFSVHRETTAQEETDTVAQSVLRIALVDDHPLWRHAVKSVLEGAGTMTVVGQASDGDDALELVSSCQPDVVLMDMQMRGVDGIEATTRIADSGLATKVLVVSSTEDPSTVLRAVRAGASGYLLKDTDAAELQDAVRRIAGGEVVFPASLAGIVLTTLRGEEPDTFQPVATPPKEVAGLSAREREVLALMAEGLSNQALAERLFVTVKTVEAHVSSIFTKLGIHPDDEVHRRVRAVVTYLTSP